MSARQPGAPGQGFQLLGYVPDGQRARHHGLLLARCSSPTDSTPSGRVIVTTPGSLVAEIDRYERNRSRFIAEAVRHELARRRREALLLSLEHPHSQSLADAQLGLSDWDATLPPAEPELLDSAAGPKRADCHSLGGSGAGDSTGMATAIQSVG